MKRDARIGLAVVLVLGLGVTLLIGRALYKRGGSSADLDSDTLVIDGTDTKLGGKGDPANANAIGIDNPTNGVATSPTQGNPAVSPNVQEFINGNMNPIPTQGERGIAHNPLVGAEFQPGPQQPVNVCRPPSANEYYAYTAVSGDSPWSISSKVFGDGKYTQKIVEANDLTTKKIKPGMILKIPVITGKATIMKLQPFNDPSVARVGHDATGTKLAPAATNAENHGGTPVAKGSHKVESGETLSTIAKKFYGSNGPKTIQLIVAANHGLDPAKLRVGQEISLPAAKQ